MTPTTTRQTAEERRAAVLVAAKREFAEKGLHGASTDDIARAAGISQPYLFRLFGTKKELYLAAARETTESLYGVFERASRGKSGVEALHAMGEAYNEILEDRDRLQMQLKCWASCDDPEVRALVRQTWRDLVDLVEQRSGASNEIVAGFFAKGVLLTVLQGMDVFARPEPWSEHLVEGCRQNTEWDEI
ncbi:MAG: TetR/AcrR family transcriptional regulator [Gaiella sp.]